MPCDSPTITRIFLPSSVIICTNKFQISSLTQCTLPNPKTLYTKKVHNHLSKQTKPLIRLAFTTVQVEEAVGFHTGKEGTDREPEDRQDSWVQVGTSAAAGYHREAHLETQQVVAAD